MRLSVRLALAGGAVLLTVAACSSSRETSPAEPTASVEQGVGACTRVYWLPTVPSGPQTVGTVVTWTATAECGKATPEYEFHIKPVGGTYSVVQKYSTTNTWRWGTGAFAAGHYVVEVTVHAKGATGAQARDTARYDLNPLTCSSYMPDAGSCPDGEVCPDGGPLCTGTTCKALGYNCGVTGDGCGCSIDCGSCLEGEVCGGGGLNTCGTGACVPLTCAQEGVTCGYMTDGCGNVIDCTTTCESVGYTCGQVADGCGNMLDCGTCTDPQYCGGGGFNVCGGNNGLDASCPCGCACGNCTGCTPTTCARLGYNCGISDDGCGCVLDCGTCPAGQTCGGGGYNICG